MSAKGSAPGHMYDGELRHGQSSARSSEFKPPPLPGRAMRPELPSGACTDICAADAFL